mmetsp:Transcript_10416/g.38678  ORF Transcript_10416/g.38678 Transcript_10416/m.38678 type:complete len:96 (+) Transcript_10416:899-1186(+)
MMDQCITTTTTKDMSIPHQIPSLPNSKPQDNHSHHQLPGIATQIQFSGFFFSVLSFNSKDGELYCAVMKEHKLQILLLPPVVFSRLKISKVYKLS